MTRHVALPGLDEATRRHTWKGSRLPTLHQGTRQCRCGGTLIQLPPVTQDPLFLHGGYGEAVRRTLALCPDCGHVQLIRRESVKPLRPRKLG